MLGGSSFQIYNASAGSGKTYQLTKNYLKIILGSSSFTPFRQILALTFTNKAVAEMKQRILDSLFAFSQTTDTPSSLFNEVSNDLKLAPNELQEKAKRLLKVLLHNYSYFEVSTIDKFNHKLIRTFAHDLKLEQNFEVELDQDLLLNQSVNRVLSKAGKDAQLTKALLDFSLEKIDNFNSWNITRDLVDIGKILFQENHAQALDELGDKKISEFTTAKNAVKKRMEAYGNRMVECANASLELMTANQLVPADFYQSWFPNFLQKVAARDFDINFKAKWKQDLENATLYTKTTKDAIKQTIDGLRSSFVANFNSLKDAFTYYTFLAKAYRSFLPLTLINELRYELKQLQKEENLLSISEFNAIISKEIKNQPIPFIYERLGEKYRHYFIDEFQDTSIKQWQNLVPLIANALEGEDEQRQKGSLMLVGDVKQAIYRWRGGEALQFLELSNGRQQPFMVAPDFFRLNHNWRSYSTIVLFNNSFFTHIANKLGNSEYQELYKLGNQQLPNPKQGGMVHVQFLEEDKQAETHPHCLETLKQIQKLIAHGAAFTDICVLVRDNKKALLLADYLSQEHIPVVSSEALLLKSSPEVNFIIHLCYYLTGSDKQYHAFAMLEFLNGSSSLDHDDIVKKLHSFEGYLQENYQVDTNQLKWQGMLDVAELAIKRFKLAEESNAFLNFFVDSIFDFNKKQQGSVAGFLDYWELKKDKLAIAAPEKTNAVQLMTVHKSKGLEFPFVIFPFADTIINDAKKADNIWVPVDANTFQGFNTIMMKANESIAEYSPEVNAAYTKETHASELDDFNVLYVAMTRAVQGLFVICNTPKKASFSYASLLSDYVGQQPNFNAEQGCFILGDLPKGTTQAPFQDPTMGIPYIYTTKTKYSFRHISAVAVDPDAMQTEAAQRGEILHAALAKITDITNVKLAVDWLNAQKQLTEAEKTFFKKQVDQVIYNKTLAPYFSESAVVWNEKDIISPSGKIYRPDRVVFLDEKATVIDYKTGTVSQKHEEQITSYAQILGQMGHIVEKSIIVYIDKEIKTTVI